MADISLARLTAAELAIVCDTVDAELNDIYGDDAEPNDTVLFDLLDDEREQPEHSDPCPRRPQGLPHFFVGCCGETICIHCDKVVG